MSRVGGEHSKGWITFQLAAAVFTHITKNKIASGRWGTYRVALYVLYVPNAHS